MLVGLGWELRAGFWGWGRQAAGGSLEEDVVSRRVSRVAVVASITRAKKGARELVVAGLREACAVRASDGCRVVADGREW